MITGIVVALPEELRTLTTKKIAKGRCRLIADNIMVAHAGAGAKNASQAAQLLISEGATSLISWGCAGALSPDLKPGDLVFPELLLTADNAEINLNSPWHSDTKTRLANFVPIYTGTLLESKELVSFSGEKKKLHNKTGAIALDMETVAIAKIAQEKNLPFLAVRAIADPVTMNLPSAISYSLNHEGEVVLTRLFLFLLKHPKELPGLMQLGLHFNAAKKTLKLTAAQLDAILAFKL